MGQVEDLDVDGAAIGAAAREDRLRRFAGKALEAALTVDDGFAEDEEVGEDQKAQADDPAQAAFALLKGPHPRDHPIALFNS